MYKRFLFSVMSIVLVGIHSQVYSQKITGSDTVLPLTQKLAEQYMAKNPLAYITVTGGGSGVGLTFLIAGNTDIAMSSRDVKFSEKLEFKRQNAEIVELTVARDALAVVVHPDNKVSKLTREQLELIYTGQITNWKDLGGEDMNIVAYARETSSGTYEFFKEVAMRKKNYAATALNMPATGAIIQSISQTKGAIGYVGLAYVNDRIKVIAVKGDGKENYVLPSKETATSGEYSIVRPLYYLYDKKKESGVKGFVDYVFSNEGNGIISKLGYIPVEKQ